MDQTMNRLTPPIDYFKEFVEPKDHFDEFKLHQCVFYHQKVVEFYPFERPAAYAMMGFCNALLGNTQKAIHEYKSSADLNPNDFWPYYNLGLLSYQKGDYSKAINYLQTALTKDLKLNIYILFNSKIYSDIRLSDANSINYNFLEGLKEGRETAYILLMESLTKTGNYEKLFQASILGLKEKFGNDDIFYYYAGMSAFYQKSYEKAAELLQSAISGNPNNSEAIFFLGMCMRVAGKEEAAQKLFDTAKEVHDLHGSAIEKALGSKVRFF